MTMPSRATNPEIEELRRALAVLNARDLPDAPPITFEQALSNTVAALDAARAVLRVYDEQGDERAKLREQIEACADNECRSGCAELL